MFCECGLESSKAQDPKAHHVGAIRQDLGNPGYGIRKIKLMSDCYPLIHEHIKRVLSALVDVAPD